MSDSAVSVSDVVRVLVIGDSARADDAASVLESSFPASSLVTAETPERAFERLDRESVHCVVYEPGSVTEESLVDRIRRNHGEVPFVALVGSEPANALEATDALEAGATDVIRPDEPPDVVVSRVRNAVDRYRLRARTEDDDWYRSVLEHSSALVLVLDREGELRYVSPSVEAETGYTPDELERKGPTRLVYPDDREAAVEAISSLVSAPLGSTHESTYRLRHADGTWHRYAVTVTNRLDDPSVDGLVVTVEDAVGTLAEDGSGSLDRLEHAFFALGQDWELTYANEEAARLFDRPRDDLPGTVVWDLLPGSVKGPFYERFLEAVRTGSVVEFEREYPPLDAWLEVHAHPSDTGLSVYARNVTVRKEASGELRDRLGIFESIVDGLDDGVVVLDDARVRLANDAAFDLLDHDTLVGREVTDVFGEELVAEILERARSPVVRRVDAIETTLERDGSRPVSISVVPLSGEDRVVCIVRDETERQESSRALSTLHRASRDLISAETRPDVCQTIVDATVDVIGAEVVGFYLREDGTLRPASFATPGSRLGVDLPTLDVEGTNLGDVLEVDEAGSYDRAEFPEFLARTGIRAERLLVVPVDDGILFATASRSDAFSGRDRAFAESLASTAEVALRMLDREATLRERDLELTRQRTRLDRIEAINERKRNIEQILVRADAREEIERGVCEQLVGIDWIEFAWIGESSVAIDEVTPRVWAGDHDDYLEAVTIALDSRANEPTGRTVASREGTAVENVVHENRDRQWRREALDRGFQSVLSIPLVYDEYVYGALTVYADRPSAFDDVARSVFAELGETIAYAINAIETKRALLTDSVTELDIVMNDTDELLSSIARRGEFQIDLQTVVPRSSGASTIFFTVPDTAPSTVTEAAASIEAVESIRLIAERESDSLFEVVVPESTIAATLVDHGGVLQTITTDGDQARFVVELSRGADVRSFVRMLQRKHPGTELVARRDRERSVRNRREFRGELRDRLTDRQLRALETAYYSGFFEWPRESTGEEVAESLGISQPTFNRHFRTAERKLFTLLFDEE